MMRWGHSYFAVKLILSVALPIVSTVAQAVAPVTMSPSNLIREFTTDVHVRKQVRFWETIFQRYDSKSIVIHDVDEPNALIDVINFSQYTQNDGQIITVAESERTDLVRRYIERYDLAVGRFSQYKDKAISYGPIERRLFEVYSRDPSLLAKLYRGEARFRGQGGLSDQFRAAAGRAQEFLPHMEAVFKRHGLPLQLTRLPFVESMFNLNARSKVGASGIWQFMPYTARDYLIVNSFIDERNNPYKASDAAAQLFLTNFRELRSWPLAVTAYNHGRGGLQRAIKDVGTEQLGEIIQRYKSPSFGFASKNFYSEFLAAVNTYDLLRRQGLIVKSGAFPQVDTLVLTRGIPVKELLRHTHLSPKDLLSMNPCLNQNHVYLQSSVILPRKYEIRVPRAAAKILKRQLIAHNTPTITVKVSMGEQL